MSTSLQVTLKDYLGLIEVKQMEENKMLIRPKSITNIFVLLILGTFALVFFIFSFIVLIRNEPITIFDGIVVKNKIVQFVISFAIAGMMLYFFFKHLSYKIKFTNEFLSAPKKSSMQNSEIILKIKDIIEYKVLVPGATQNPTIYQYIVFSLKNGQSRKLWIKPFTKRQFVEMLTMIQERGGLENQILSIK